MSITNISAVTELDRSQYKTKVFSGKHLIYADEPLDLGGTDEGMSPQVLLLASLGSCTAITMRMYADRKKMALEAIKINLSLAIEAQNPKETIINRKIELTGELSEADRDRLLLIADKCPVHKMLTNPIQIITELHK
jgi:putative redox protein